MALDDEDLKKHIEDDSFKKYQQKRKPLQVHTVLNLLREQHTFLLAATGFGKLHIPEIYLNIVLHICRMRTCSGTTVRWGVTQCMVKLMSQNKVVEGCGIAPGRYFNVPQLIHPERTHGFARIPPL